MTEIQHGQVCYLPPEYQRAREQSIRTARAMAEERRAASNGFSQDRFRNLNINGAAWASRWWTGALPPRREVEISERYRADEEEERRKLERERELEVLAVLIRDLERQSAREIDLPIHEDHAERTLRLFAREEAVQRHRVAARELLRRQRMERALEPVLVTGGLLTEELRVRISQYEELQMERDGERDVLIRRARQEAELERQRQREGWRERIPQTAFQLFWGPPLYDESMHQEYLQSIAGPNDADPFDENGELPGYVQDDGLPGYHRVNGLREASSGQRADFSTLVLDGIEDLMRRRGEVERRIERLQDERANLRRLARRARTCR